MTIAFDFDRTITADPRTMLAAMELFRSAGHTVLVATLRWPYESEAVERLTRGLYPVVYCSHKTKHPECLRAGFAVDVWVDDMPEFCRESLVLTIKNEEL